jgi:hypothetical protein
MKNLVYVGSIVLNTVAMVFSLNSARALDNTCASQYCTIRNLYSNTYEIPYVWLVAKSGNNSFPAKIIRQCIANCPQPGSKDRPACVAQCRSK